MIYSTAFFSYAIHEERWRGASLSVQQERPEKNGGKYTNQINPITAMHKIVTTTFFYLFATIFWLALQGCIEKFSI